MTSDVTRILNAIEGGGTKATNDGHAICVARLESAIGGLYFGTGSALAPETFFSGLIDDVRIYNRAVKP
jgi:hypothetical protein